MALAMVVVGLAVSAASAQSGGLGGPCIRLQRPSAARRHGHHQPRDRFREGNRRRDQQRRDGRVPGAAPRQGATSSRSRSPASAPGASPTIQVRISDTQTIDVQLAEEIQERVKGHCAGRCGRPRRDGPVDQVLRRVHTRPPCSRPLLPKRADARSRRARRRRRRQPPTSTAREPATSRRSSPVWPTSIR